MNTPIDHSQVYRLLRETKSKWEFERILCVWLKTALSLNSEQIAIAIGWTAASVRRIQARFAKEGVQCFALKPKGGRKRANMSLEREKHILEKFARLARRGATLNVQQIKQAYELSVNKAVSRSTIYRLIERHGLKRFLPKARLKPK